MEHTAGDRRDTSYLLALRCLYPEKDRSSPSVFSFIFLNHVIESSFIPLEMIYEHRNYIPSMFFFVPLAIVMLAVHRLFSYKKAIQFTMVAVFTFLLSAQGHTVFVRNALFAHPAAAMD